MNVTLDDLMREIRVLDPERRDDFVEYPFVAIQAISQRGSKPDKPAGAAMIDGIWIPKSQLRYDSSQKLYISLWMQDRLNQNE